MSVALLEILVLSFVAKPLDAAAAKPFLGLVNMPSDLRHGSPTLIGLGDSFGAAGGPTTNVFRLTAHQMALEGRAVPSVVNLSIGGLAPIDEVMLLKNFAKDAQAGDLLLQLIFVGNDLERASGTLWVAGSFPLRRAGSLFSVEGWLWPRLLVMSMIDRIALTKPPSPPTAFPEIPVGSSRLSEVINAAKFQDSRRAAVYPDAFAEILWNEARGTWQEDYDFNENSTASGALTQIGQWAKSRNVRWAVAIVPDRAALDPSVKALLPALEPQEDPDGPRRWVANAATAAGADLVIDLTETFRAAAEHSPSPWLPNDTHWSTYGRELASRELASRLGASGLWFRAEPGGQ